MTDEAVSPLRRRMIENMTIRKFAPKTQHDDIQRVKNFAAFLGRSPDTASFEDVRRYQLHLAAAACWSSNSPARRDAAPLTNHANQRHQDRHLMTAQRPFCKAARRARRPSIGHGGVHQYVQRSRMSLLRSKLIQETRLRARTDFVSRIKLICPVQSLREKYSTSIFPK